MDSSDVSNIIDNKTSQNPTSVQSDPVKMSLETNDRQAPSGSDGAAELVQNPTSVQSDPAKMNMEIIDRQAPSGSDGAAELVQSTNADEKIENDGDGETSIAANVTLDTTGSDINESTNADEKIENDDDAETSIAANITIDTTGSDINESTNADDETENDDAETSIVANISVDTTESDINEGDNTEAGPDPFYTILGGSQSGKQETTKDKSTIKSGMEKRQDRRNDQSTPSGGTVVETIYISDDSTDDETRKPRQTTISIDSYGSDDGGSEYDCPLFEEDLDSDDELPLPPSPPEDDELPNSSPDDDYLHIPFPPNRKRRASTPHPMPREDDNDDDDDQENQSPVAKSRRLPDYTNNQEYYLFRCYEDWEYVVCTQRDIVGPAEEDHMVHHRGDPHRMLKLLGHNDMNYIIDAQKNIKAMETKFYRTMNPDGVSVVEGNNNIVGQKDLDDDDQENQSPVSTSISLPDNSNNQ